VNGAPLEINEAALNCLYDLRLNLEKKKKPKRPCRANRNAGSENR
jgi:hypothetical protein